MISTFASCSCARSDQQRERHDLELVRRRFPRTLLVARRLIAEGDTDDVLTAEHLAAARHHIEAWDDTAPFCEAEPAR